MKYSNLFYIILMISSCVFMQEQGMFLFKKSLPQKTHEEVQKDLASGIWHHNLPIVQEALHNGADPCEIIPEGADGVMFHEQSILYHAICGQDYVVIKPLVIALPHEKIKDITLPRWAYHDVRVLKLLLRAGCSLRDSNNKLFAPIPDMVTLLYALGKNYEYTWAVWEEPAWFEEAAKTGKEMYQQRLQKYQDVVIAHLGDDLLDDINKIVIAYAGVPLDWDDILLDEQEEKEKLERASVECIIQ